jgi:hypothetical protein
VILNCERDDDDWLILTSNHHDDILLQYQNQQQQHPLAKRVSLDTCEMLLLKNNSRSHPMDLDDLSFLDGGGVNEDDLWNNDDDDDDDDDETTIDEYKHRQWLEHRRRLQICMEKSQESRQQIVSQNKVLPQPSLSSLSSAFTQTHQSMRAVQDNVFFVGDNMIMDNNDTEEMKY